MAGYVWRGYGAPRALPRPSLSLSPLPPHTTTTFAPKTRAALRSQFLCFVCSVFSSPPFGCERAACDRAQATHGAAPWPALCVARAQQAARSKQHPPSLTTTTSVQPCAQQVLPPPGGGSRDAGPRPFGLRLTYPSLSPPPPPPPPLPASSRALRADTQLRRCSACLAFLLHTHKFKLFDPHPLLQLLM